MASRNILIVEDEPDIRLTLRALLEGVYFTVDEAEDGLWALEKLKKHTYQLMILDLMMPQMDGFDVLKNIKPEVLQQMPVLILTARSQDEELFKGYGLGAAYYMTKPFANHNILAAIRELVEDMTPEQSSRIDSILYAKLGQRPPK